jgi:hypothetical protein
MKNPNAYETHLDAKKRFVLRGATATHYRVFPRADGSFLLKPLAMISGRELRRLRAIKADFERAGIVAMQRTRR